MRVQLDVPDRVWAQLVDLAEERMTTVPVVVSAAIADALRPSAMARLKVQSRRNHVVQLVKAGLTDAQIAERLDEMKNYVAETRRSAGLPANRFGRATGQERKSA